MAEQTQNKRRVLKVYTYRGMEIEPLLKLNNEQLMEQFPCRQRRRFTRGLKHKYSRLMMKIRNSKKNVPVGEKPPAVKTHLRNAIIVPEMVGSIVGVYSGKVFTNVEIRFEMIGRYLGEFSMTYKLTRHGKLGVGATGGSKKQA